MDPLTGSTQDRATFFEKWDSLRLPSATFSDYSCNGCRHHLARHATPRQPEARVLLHGKHVYGEHCAREWLEDRNTCPSCKYVLFQEVPVADDVLNLRRIWNLQHLQYRYRQILNDEMRAKTYAQWRKLVDDRATAFVEGKISTPKSDYGPFHPNHESRIRQLPREPRSVDTQSLISKLDNIWDIMFMQASRAATQNSTAPVANVSAKLEAPCHPLTAVLRHQMVKVLKKHDGLVISASKLYGELHREFSGSSLRTLIVNLTSIDEAPQGLFICQGLLVDGLIKCFLELPVCERLREG